MSLPQSFFIIQEMKTSLLVFFFSFLSFLLGWSLAVYFSPSPPSSSLESEEKAFFMDKMKDSLFFLFDPYDPDLLGQERKKDSVIKKGQKPFQVELISEKEKPEEEKTQDELASPSETKDSEEKEEEEKPKSDLEKALEAIQMEYDKLARTQLKNLPSQSPFSLYGEHSFLVEVFSSREEADKHYQKMKEQFPLWSFFIKASYQHVKVYLGPFDSKEKAEEFKKNLPLPVPFSLDFLMKRPLVEKAEVKKE